MSEKKKGTAKVIPFKKSKERTIEHSRYSNSKKRIFFIILTVVVILVAVLLNMFRSENGSTPLNDGQVKMEACVPIDQMPLKSSYDTAHSYKRKGEYRMAKNCFNDAIKVSQQSGEYARVFESQVQLGQIMRIESRYEQALDYLEQAFKTQKQHLSAEKNRYYYALHEKASILMGADKLKEAIELQLEVLSYLEETGRTNSRLYAIIQLDTGIAYTKLGLYKEAKEIYKQAELSLVESENSRQLARLWNAIGIMEIENENAEAALQQFNKALSIRTEFFPGHKDDIAETLSNLGTAYKSINECAKAMPYFNKAETILTSLYGANSIQLLSLKNNIGLCYMQLKDDRLAKQYFESILKVAKYGLPKPHLTTAKIHANLGVILKNLWDLPRSCQHFKAALSIHQEILGNTHPDTVSIQEQTRVCSAS